MVEAMLFSASWVHLAVFASVLMALLVQANHYLRMPGNVLIIVRSVFGLAFIAPLLPMQWPTSAPFYIYLLLAAFSAFFAELILFETARRYGGRLTSMYLPVKIFVAFGLWLSIDFVYAQALFARPIVLLGVIMCLGFSTVGILQMRGCDRSWPAFRRVVFVGILFALLDIFLKLGVEGTNKHETALLFVFLCYVIQLFLGAGLAVAHREDAHHMHKALPQGIKKVMFLSVVGLVVGGLSTLASYVISVSVSLSPNPGYVAALTMLSIVWLSIFNRMRGIDDRAPWLSVFCLTLSALGLILLTTNH